MIYRMTVSTQGNVRPNASTLMLARHCKPGTVSLNRKAGAASAGRFRVGILDLEVRAHQVFDEIDLGPAQEFQRNGVDEDARAVAFDQKVVAAPGIVEAEIILVARAAAAVDGNAKHNALAFGRAQFRNAPGGTRADTEIRLIDHYVQRPILCHE